MKMKNLRKAIALVLAVLVMFTSVPNSFANTVSQQDKLDKLVELGALHGEGNGVDGEKTMTRYRSIVMLLRLKGLEDEMMSYDYEGKDTFADAEGQWEYQQRLMAYIKNTPELGIYGYPDGTFRPYQEITSQEYARVMLEALGYDINVDYTWETVEEKAQEIGLISSLKDGEFKVFDVAEYTYDALSTVSKSDDITLGEKLGFVIVETAYNVKSVSANNLREIFVVFSKAVDADSAKTIANYKLNGAALDSADELSVLEDGKTVAINLAGTGALSNQTEYELTIKDVKDLSGNKLAETKVKFTSEDVTIPQVVSVEVTGPKSFKVNFSEPINNKGTYIIDDGRYYASSTLSSDGKSVELSIGVKISEGEHKVVIENATDFYGFKVVKTTLPFTFTDDVSVPTVSVDSTTETKVTLKFSKPVKATGLNTDVTAYYGYNNEAQYKGIVAAVQPSNGYSDTYTVTFTQPIPQGSHTLYLNTKANKLEDKWGNDVDSNILSFVVSVDNDAPEVVSIAAEKDNKIVVTFSEDLNTNDAVKKTYYTLKDTNGDVMTTSSFADVDSKGHFNGNASLSYDSDADTVTINLTNSLPGGTYYLSINDIRDASYKKNVMEDTTIGFAISDTTGPNPTTAIVNGDGSKIRISFDEPMSAANLTDTDNYRLVVDGASSIALPSGSSIAIMDSKTIEITLGTADANIDNAGNDYVQVAGELTDVTGNPIGGFYKQVQVAGDGIGVVADTAGDKVYFVAKNTIEVNIDKELQAIDASDISVVTTGSLNVGSAYYTNESGKSTVTVILDGDLKTDVSDFTSITFAAGAITNVFGTDNSTITLNTAGEFADEIAPEISKVEAIDTTHVKLTFSEAVEPSTVSKYTYTVSDNTVTAIAWGAGNTELTLTIQDAIATDATPDVVQVFDIEDVPGNVLAAGTEVPSTADAIAPVVVTAFGDGNTDGETIAFGNSITIAFSEVIDSTSQTAVETAISGAATGGTLVYDWNGADLTITNSHASQDATFAGNVVVANVSDGTNTTASVTVVTH